MANLNLSQFTEKTLVADADWVFVWDTVGAISKKVSRNSLLNSGTLATSAPVTISQTWDGTGSTVFKALVVNATTPGTTSADASLLLDLQVGGTSKFRVEKTSVCRFSRNGILFDAFGADTTAINVTGQETIVFSRGIGGAARQQFSSVGLVLSNDQYLGFSSTAFATGTPDTLLVRDSASGNTLALRNGAAAQTFNVYGTYTSGTSYERLTLSAPSSANAIIGTNKGSGGGTARGLELQTDGVTRMTIDSAGAASFGTNSVSCQNVILPAGGLLVWAGTGRITNPSTGVFQLLDGAQTSFNRLQFGGTADTFPAIARDGAGIKFTGAAAGLTSHIKVPAVAVTSLPSAATAGVGARAFVNDALAPVFGSAVANGGSAKVPVYSDGSAWYVG